jgi:hypothetical protein
MLVVLQDCRFLRMGCPCCASYRFRQRIVDTLTPIDLGHPLSGLPGLSGTRTWVSPTSTQQYYNILFFARLWFILTPHTSLHLPARFLKDEDLGFIAEPHVSPVEQLPASARCFVIVASDGLWDVLSEERAAGLVLKVRAAPLCKRQGQSVHARTTCGLLSPPSLSCT